MSSRDIIFSKTLSGRKPREGWGAGGREEGRERGERVFNSKILQMYEGSRKKVFTVTSYIHCNCELAMYGEIED